MKKVHSQYRFVGVKDDMLLPIIEMRQLKLLEFILMGCNLTTSSAKFLQTLLYKLQKLDNSVLNLYGNIVNMNLKLLLDIHQRQVKTLDIELNFNIIILN
ncbi:unnamed protein product [Paramecium sonneborni]|uniref:Uncharacterized protein n=1 Tax=Paramecium sonneborni TaxID=65129 RepID=A0A8S1RTY1_9CILI|nr:unnamed protein product [Paramecium sonneborni]